jgi:hypothetical protein
MPARPVPLEQLVGAPLRALVLGQGIAGQATADFIAEIGLTPDGADRPPTARTFEFTFLHPVPDPENPGGVIDTPTTVSVPLLTVLPIPNLDITEATIDFDANVVSVEQLRARQPELRIERPKSSALDGPVQLIAAYTQRRAADGSGGGALSISVKVARAPLGQGLETVVGLLHEGITARPVDIKRRRSSKR